MALNYPRLDNASGVWNMKEVTEAVLGGYWPNAAGGRLLFGGGNQPSSTDTIEYITAATTGNSEDFGDLTAARVNCLRAAGSFTRILWGGGDTGDASNIIDYVTASTTGNAADFGDLTVARNAGGSSNSTRAVYWLSLIHI